MDGSCLSSDKITVVFPAPRNPVNTVIEEVRFDMIVKRIESRPVVMVTLSATDFPRGLGALRWCSLKAERVMYHSGGKYFPQF